MSKLEYALLYPIAKIYYFYKIYIGVNFIPKKMQETNKIWLIASRHPWKSITWTWALYWDKDFKFNVIKKFGFHIQKQKMVLK